MEHDERHPPEPTSTQCTEKERSYWRGQTAYACWYPQMGGYGGKAVIVVGVDVDQNGTRDGCDVYVWHDGEFPFGDGAPPRRLHHCSGEQFVIFGEFVEWANAALRHEERKPDANR